MRQYVNESCPVCGGYVILSTNGIKICEKCHYVLPGSNWAYSSTTTSAEKYCYNCNTKMIQNGDWWECPNCHYGHMDYIRGLPKDFTKLSDEEVEMSKYIFESTLHIPYDNVWSVGKTVGSLEPNTLTIEKCEKIKMHQKEMDIDFEFDTKKIENINTIIINGHKFVRDSYERDHPKFHEE